MAPCLELFRLTKAYPGPAGEAVVVKDFSLRVERGEMVSLVGHSGCGKSTVLSMVAGLSRPTRGGIVLDGREVREPGPDRGVVFQSPCLLPWRTALENVLLAAEQAEPRLPGRLRRRRAAECLERVGLDGCLEKRPAELSAGMRQRVGIARAFALDPKVLLLDEPFAMLDSLTREDLQDLLLSVWQEERKTALLVTHDVDEALLLSDRVVLMTSGPAARVGEVLSVPFPRPRERARVADDPRHGTLRARVLGFLERQGEGPAAPPAGGRPEPFEKMGGGPDSASLCEVARSA